MAQQVEFIKVSRLDQDGIDNTLTLQSLTYLTIPYSNGNISTYPILSIAGNREYFLYTVGVPTNYSGAPVETPNTTLDYSFVGLLNTGSVVGPPVGGTGFNIFYSNPLPIASATTDASNFFNPTTGKYELKTYPNKIINIRSKVNLSATTTYFTVNNIGIFVIPPGVTNLNPSTAPPNFLGINAQNPYLLKLDPNGPYGSSSPGVKNSDFNIDVPLGRITPGSSIEIRAIGGFMDAPFQIYAGSELIIDSSIAVTGSTIETIPEPFLPEPFKGTNCDILLNNVELYPLNPFLQDLDYSGNPNIPVNFDQILNGTANRGTIPQSYYTALSQTTIRYNGSKIQSSDVNIYDPNAGISSFGEPINIGTFGQTPSIDSLDNLIVEFEWAGGTNPEIPGGSQFKLSNRLFEVSSKELIKTVTPDQNVVEFGVKNTIKTGSYSENNSFIRTISQSRGDYYQVLNNTFGPGKQLTPFQYGSTSGQNELPSFTTVADTTQWVPSVSSFASTSSYANGAAGSGYWIPGTSIINLNGLFSAVETQITELGANYNTSTAIDVSSTGWVEEINYSLSTGNRWFITLLRNFEFPVGGIDASNRFTDVQNGSELNKLGVFEILGIQQGALPSTGGPVRINVDVSPTSFPSMGGTGFTALSIGTWSTVQKLSNIGFLIWKSRSNYSGQYITTDQPASGIENGAFYSRFATDVVREEFENVTKEYGNNQTG